MYDVKRLKSLLWCPEVFLPENEKEPPHPALSSEESVCSCITKLSLLKYLQKFTGKYMCWSLIACIVRLIAMVKMCSNFCLVWKVLIFHSKLFLSYCNLQQYHLNYQHTHFSQVLPCLKILFFNILTHLSPISQVSPFFVK